MLIRTKDLIKTFGDKTVIEHLNLEVEEGKLLAYIGTNGAGKSTTMKVLIKSFVLISIINPLF